MDKNTRPRVAVAIPCYNCADQIPRVLSRIYQSLLGRVERIWIIDNGSTDGTPEAAAKAIERLGLGNLIEIRRNRANYGLGGSHKVGLLLAEQHGMDYLGIIHGDDQGRAEEFRQFLKAVEEYPDAAAILGSRFMPGSRLEGYSSIRIAGNVGLNAFYSFLSLRPTWDMGAGMNLFRLKDLKDHAYLGFTDSFTFNMDLLLHYFRRGANLRYLPITWTETDQVSNAKTFKVGWQALKTVLLWRARREERLQRQPSDYLSDPVDQEHAKVA